MPDEVLISKRLVLINSISTVAARLLNIAVLVWLQQYLLKHISAAEYSLYPVVMSIIIFVPLIKTVLTSGIARYAVEAKAVGDSDRVTAIASSAFFMLCLASLLIGLIGAVVSWNIGSIITIPEGRLFDAQIMSGLLFGSMFVRLPLIPFSSGFFIRQRLVLSNLIQLSAELLRLAMLFALLFGVSTRVIWVVVAAVSADILRALVMCIWSMRLVPELRYKTNLIQLDLIRELTSFGSWRFLSQIATRIRSHADVIVLNQLATSIDVAVYHVGSLPMRQLNSTVAEASMSLVPPLTAMHARGLTNEMRAAYLRGGRYALWLGMLLVVPAMVFHREIIELYLVGRYSQAGLVMAILLGVVPFEYGHLLIARLVTATATVKRYALCSLAMQLVNIVLTIVFVGYFRLGAVGSALATLAVAACLGPILIWPIGFQMVGLKLMAWVRWTFIPGIVPAIWGAVAWLGIHEVAQPQSWVSLAACCLGGAVVYAIAWLAILAPDDRDYLKELMSLR